jgi:hypothetical protein
VIAFGRGGATETIATGCGRQEPTGLLFAQQTSECLAEAIQHFEKEETSFSPLAARRNAQRFQRRRFVEEMFGWVEEVLEQRTDTADRRAA